MENFEEDQPFDNPVNELIEPEFVYNGPIIASIYKKVEQPRNIADEALALVASANAETISARKVGRFEAMEVLSRSLERTLMNFQNPDQRAFTALREVSDYINMATTGAQPKIASAHKDLLPVGHPLSTKEHNFTEQEVARQRGEWMSADPRIAEEFRPLVASAFETRPSSLQREYLLAKLEATSPTEVPREVLLSLTSAGDPYGGGNSFLARSARARAQRRDRKGRFAWMGGGARAFLGKAGRGISTLFRFAGYDKKSDSFDLEYRNHPTLGSGLIRVPASKVEAMKAILDEDLVNLPEPKMEIIDSNLLVDPDNLERIDAPSGWVANADNLFESEDGWYVIRENDTANFIRKNGLNDVDRIRGGNRDGSIDNNQPLYFIGRKDGSIKKPFAVTQSWADTQALLAKYDKRNDRQPTNIIQNQAPSEVAGQNQPDHWTETSGMASEPNAPRTFKDRGGNYEVVQHDISSAEATNLIQKAKEDGTPFQSFDGARLPNPDEPLLDLYRVDRAGRKTKVGLFQDWEDVDDAIESVDLEGEEFRPNTPAGDERPSTAYDFYGDIVVDTQENYGNTVDFVSGLKPSDGYIVSTGKEFLGPDGQIRERRVTPEEFDRNGKTILKEFARNNRDLLTQPGFYLGTWVDEVENPDGTKSEMIFLDVSQRIQNPDEAFAKADARGEIAYWGVKEGHSFYTADEKRNRDLTEQIIAENEPIRKLREEHLATWDEMPMGEERDDVLRERLGKLNNAIADNLRSIFQLTDGRDVGNRSDGLWGTLMEARNLYVGEDDKTIKMNHALRNGLPVASSQVAKIDTLTKSSKLKRDYIFHRGVALTSEQAQDLNVGDVFTDKGFQSVSSNFGTALDYVGYRFRDLTANGQNKDAVKAIFHITTPAGFNAVSVDRGNEVVLARNAEMKVTKKWKENGIVHFDLAIIGENKNARTEETSPQEIGGSPAEPRRDFRGAVRRVGGEDPSSAPSEPRQETQQRGLVDLLQAGRKTRNRRDDDTRRAMRETIQKNASKTKSEEYVPLTEEELHSALQNAEAVASEVADVLPESGSDLVDPNNPLNVLDARDISGEILGPNFDNGGKPVPDAMREGAAVFLEPNAAWLEVDAKMDEIGTPLAQHVLGLLMKRHGREFRAAQDAKDEFAFAERKLEEARDEFVQAFAPLKRRLIQQLSNQPGLDQHIQGEVDKFIQLFRAVDAGDPQVADKNLSSYSPFHSLLAHQIPMNADDEFVAIKLDDMIGDFRGLYQIYKNDPATLKKEMLALYYDHMTGTSNPEQFTNIVANQHGFGSSIYPPLLSLIPEYAGNQRRDGGYYPPKELEAPYEKHYKAMEEMARVQGRYTNAARGLAEKMSEIAREVLADAGVEFDHGETIPFEWKGVSDIGFTSDYKDFEITPNPNLPVTRSGRTENGAKRIVADAMGRLPKSVAQLLGKYFSTNPLAVVGSEREFTVALNRNQDGNVGGQLDLVHSMGVGGVTEGAAISGVVHESTHLINSSVIRSPMTALEWVRRSRLTVTKDANGKSKADFVASHPDSSGLSYSLGGGAVTTADGYVSRQEISLFSPDMPHAYDGKLNGRDDQYRGTRGSGSGAGNNPFTVGELTSTIVENILGGGADGTMSSGNRGIYRVQAGVNPDGTPRYVQFNPLLVSPTLLAWGMANILVMDKLAKKKLAGN